MANVQAAGVNPGMAGMSDKDLEEYVRHDSTHVQGGDGGRTSFAEYRYWAERQREAEAQDKTPIHSKGFGKLFAAIKKSKTEERVEEVNEKSPEYSTDDLVGMSDRDIDHMNARRALRQAGWATVFYLITCDILGPFNAPYAIASIGMVPGILLYILFGIFAFLGGCYLCWMYCKLDSLRHPVRTYGDLCERIFHPVFRHFSSFLQAVQLILNCGIICLSNGQGLYQITRRNLCFVVCVVIWAGVGMVVGQIRGLQNFSVLANLSVWLNLLIIFLSMGFIAHSPPNIPSAIQQYGAAIASGPVSVKAAVNQPVFAQVNGVFNMVFAYGGAMVFPEIMAEMRRPKQDFIKGMAIAQALIFVAYLMYGVYVYAFQGQYTLPLAYQGVSKYAWQTIGNVLALITGFIAAGLYGNIGLKVIYVYLVEDLFKGPPLISTKGRIMWSIIVPIWWSVAFVIGAGIPQIGALSGLVAAMCIFQFTYTFPPLLMLGMQMQEDAALADEKFTTPGVRPRRIDSWRQMSRWQRGFTAGGTRRTVLKSLNVLYLTAALATLGLGLWATGTDLREALAAGGQSSYGCPGPV